MIEMLFSALCNFLPIFLFDTSAFMDVVLLVTHHYFFLFASLPLFVAGYLFVLLPITAVETFLWTLIIYPLTGLNNVNIESFWLFINCWFHEFVSRFRSMLMLFSSFLALLLAFHRAYSQTISSSCEPIDWLLCSIFTFICCDRFLNILSIAFIASERFLFHWPLLIRFSFLSQNPSRCSSLRFRQTKSVEPINPIAMSSVVAFFHAFCWFILRIVLLVCTFLLIFFNQVNRNFFPFWRLPRVCLIFLLIFLLSKAVAQATTPLLTLLFSTFAGFMAPRNTIPDGW